MIAALIVVVALNGSLEPKLESHRYKHLEQAATHALHDSYTASKKLEFGGTIYQNDIDKTYSYTIPHTAFKRDAIVHNHRAKIDGWHIVADYHTHPCLSGYSPEYFSPNDVYSNQYWHVIGFIGDLCTGSVHKFDPSTDRGDDVYLPEPDNAYVTRGHYVGSFEVTK